MQVFKGHVPGQLTTACGTTSSHSGPSFLPFCMYSGVHKQECRALGRGRRFHYKLGFTATTMAPPVGRSANNMCHFLHVVRQ